VPAPGGRYHQTRNLKGRPIHRIHRTEATPFDTLVAVAPKRSEHFADYKAALEVLRVEGVADKRASGLAAAPAEGSASRQQAQPQDGHAARIHEILARWCA
jgi:hypothetical protein